MSPSSKLPSRQGTRTAKRFVQIFRQGEEDVCIASLARWNAQFKDLAELKKRCQNMMQEVKFSSERQEILKGMVEDKIRLQRRATEKYYEQIFEEMKELEEKKSIEVLLLVQKKKVHFVRRYLHERDEARRLQRSESSRWTKEGGGLTRPCLF